MVIQRDKPIHSWGLAAPRRNVQVRIGPRDLTVKYVGRPFAGFAIAGEDRHFYPARPAFIVKGKDDPGREQFDESRLPVSHALVAHPVAVRYAWARNPIGNSVNLRHHEGTIPIVSFRTDAWDWPDTPFEVTGEEARQTHRQAIN